MKKRIIALILTVFLGAGVGHLYLRKFLKAAVLIGINIALVGILFLHIDKEKIMKSESPIMVLNEFIAANKEQLLYHDLLIAALWAYALTDVWKLTEIKNGK